MKIENYREQGPGSYFVALFDVYLDKAHLRLRNMKLCVSKKGIHFLGYPSFGVEGEDKEKKQWTPYFEFSDEKKKDFEDTVFEELGPFVRGPINRFRRD